MTTSEKTRKNSWTRAMAHPGLAFRVMTALWKGHLYRLWGRLRGTRSVAGSNFRVYGRLSLKGPGRVIFGDNVSIFGKVTPWTYAKDATITIGSRTMMNNTRFGCAREIRIGEDCIVAEVRVVDTDFHSTRADRRQEDAPVRVAPVLVGDNVWIGELAALLPGTRIGDHSVVSFGAVCMRDYPARKIIMGNPARVAAPIPESDIPVSQETEAAAMEKPTDDTLSGSRFSEAGLS